MWANDYACVETASNGDCFFDSISIALKYMTPEEDEAATNRLWALGIDGKITPSSPAVKASGYNAELLRTLVAASIYTSYIRPYLVDWREVYLALRSTGDEAVINYRHVAPLECGITPETIDEVFANMMKPSIYWGDEFARRCIEELLNIRFLVFDEAGVPVVGPTHTTSLNYNPKLFILLHLRGSRTQCGHYMPLVHKATGKCVFTLKTLPPDVIVLYRKGIPPRVLEDGTLSWFYTLRT